MIAEIIGVAILAGCAMRLIFLGIALRKLSQLRKSSSPISSASESAAVLAEVRIQVDARAEFRFSSDIHSPVTFGLLKPIILLPEQFSFMEGRFQRAIACHELLHVRRRDWAYHVVEEVLRGALWFHPAITWLVSRVRLAREQVVDGDVIRLTNARKTYLEALLTFANGKARAAAIPAPPFLGESHFAERVAMILKEVRMSRTKLVATLMAITCWLAWATTAAVWAFPLKAAPRGLLRLQGVAGGVTGGVSWGVNGGVATEGPAEGGKGRIPGGVTGAVLNIPDLDRSTIWTDTVKKGSMVRQVRGLGTLVHAEGASNLVARVTLPDGMTADVRVNDDAVVDTRNGLVKGHVSAVSASASDGTRSVEIALDGAVPEGAGADTPIAGTIDIERLEDVLSVGRPIHVGAESSTTVFRVAIGGDEAVRVKVKFGRASVQAIEVLDGLKVGDQIILSDMSNWDKVDRIHLK
jgi:hypothetical protein